ncbi:MAG: alanine-zipper protein [Candidatus Helarchaeota archaeon]
MNRIRRPYSISVDNFDLTKPRLGRRESEPHSEEVTYLYNVLTTNFPNSRTLWDLHHYFQLDNMKIGLQFDISFFLNWTYNKTLASYKASMFNNRIPDLVINILSKSTWKSDIGEHVDYCEALKIPIYIIFPPYYVTSQLYKPPFIRVYKLKNEMYNHYDYREITLFEGKELDSDKIIFLDERIPFRIGLMQRKKRHYNNEPLYKLIIIDKNENKVLLTNYELFKQKYIESKKRANEAEKRANEAEKRANEAEKENIKLKDKIKDLERLINKNK